MGAVEVRELSEVSGHALGVRGELGLESCVSWGGESQGSDQRLAFPDVHANWTELLACRGQSWSCFSPRPSSDGT